MSHLVTSSLQLMQFWIDYFYKAQMIVSKTGFLALNDLWSWPISSRSFSHDFAIKPLKYIPSCCVHSTARTVLDGLFPYLAQMITNMSKVCRVQRPLTLTYIFKAIQTWLCNKTVEIWHILLCMLYSSCSSGWILSLFLCMLVGSDL